MSQLPQLNKVVSIFTSMFRVYPLGKITGQLFYPKSSTGAGMEDVRMHFRCHSHAKIEEGAEIIGSEGTHYLLTRNGVADSGSLDYKTFKAIELPHLVSVSRKTTIEDPATRKPKTSYTLVDQRYVSVEPLSGLSDTLRRDTMRYKGYTAMALQQEDMIESNWLGTKQYTVSDVVLRRGVYEFEMYG